MSAQHRTMTPDAFFSSWERDGLSAALVTFSGRTYIEIKTRSGRTVLVGIADATDLAAAIDRIVSHFVAAEVAKKRGEAAAR